MVFLTFFIVLIGWIFSLCLHEFSHAIVAYNGGDYTVREKGYLSFNPLKYTHPIFSIVLPLVFLLLGGIGLPGGAVYIETWRIRSRNWLSLMSLAGPTANLVVAIILGIVLRLSPVSPTGIWPALSFLLVLQISAVLFNLIPLPPFDGYNALEPFLPFNIRETVNQFRSMAIWIILLLFWYVPVVGDVFWGAVQSISTALGANWVLVAIGLDQFQFWKHLF
jgi:Zn-dependent protease